MAINRGPKILVNAAAAGAGIGLVVVALVLARSGQVLAAVAAASAAVIEAIATLLVWALVERRHGEQQQELERVRGAETRANIHAASTEARTLSAVEGGTAEALLRGARTVVAPDEPTK
jgi:hypothetical protein